MVDFTISTGTIPDREAEWQTLMNSSQILWVYSPHKRRCSAEVNKLLECIRKYQSSIKANVLEWLVHLNCNQQSKVTPTFEIGIVNNFGPYSVFDGCHLNVDNLSWTFFFYEYDTDQGSCSLQPTQHLYFGSKMEASNLKHCYEFT